jgi:hypothetical protein
MQGNMPSLFIITFEISKASQATGQHYGSNTRQDSCKLTYCGSRLIYRWNDHKTKSFIFSSRNSHVVRVTNIWSRIVGHIWRRIQNSFIMIWIISLAIDMYCGFQSSGIWNCVNRQVFPYISTTCTKPLTQTQRHIQAHQNSHLH